jgi:hypothetical protein
MSHSGMLFYQQFTHIVFIQQKMFCFQLCPLARSRLCCYRFIILLFMYNKILLNNCSYLTIVGTLWYLYCIQFLVDGTTEVLIGVSVAIVIIAIICGVYIHRKRRLLGGGRRKPLASRAGKVEYIFNSLNTLTVLEMKILIYWFESNSCIYFHIHVVLRKLKNSLVQTKFHWSWAGEPVLIVRTGLSLKLNSW